LTSPSVLTNYSLTLRDTGTGIGELELREHHPLCQESGGGWRKDEARPRAGISASCSFHCFDTVR